MPRLRRRRDAGQALALAAVAMVAMLGFLAFVVDAGMFFMIRRELQNTADTAAASGAAFLYARQPGEPPLTGLPLISKCQLNFGLSDPDEIYAAQMACTYGDYNAGTARKLCLGDVQMDNPTMTAWPGHGTRAMIVNFHCEAGYSFGRIIPGLTSRTIGAHAEGVIGLRSAATGPDVVNFTRGFAYQPPPVGPFRATRLINN